MTLILIKCVRKYYKSTDKLFKLHGDCGKTWREHHKFARAYNMLIDLKGVKFAMRVEQKCKQGF